ncbi:glycosyl hydrolase [Ammoniphilus oxalaticus]|uniref:Glycosyl hydrolase n=1 Tax=Ammoniphilus oxalaticus TaxID=66863 RepID=A0A419SDM0_9BACL|nr:glycoside hydrolase family 15 protein [Ammoniphilus oxalaticus]RKD21047.1 glycosyl hydrolase [Ammoniphilus oxalaticus]
MSYIERSKQVILSHQDASGAFVASPSFEHYRYSWLRDGTFIAYSLDCVGEQQAAERFYRWCAESIERYRAKAEQVIALAVAGQEVPQSLLLHTRYTVKGEEINAEWGTFQLDGYGAWLWGLSEHITKWNNPSLLEEWRPTIELIVDYLMPLWKMPNFDCWEEFGDDTHPSTIAAIYGGLRSVAGWMDAARSEKISRTLDAIKRFMQEEATINGHYIKTVGKDEVDASLLWLHVPYRLADGHDSIMQNTVNLIEQKLVVEQGVHRYPQDVYYGGGQWVLLTAWLGWHYAEVGNQERAEQILSWVRAQFNDSGHLPEQTPARLLAPDHYQPWLDRWGPPACPLLWSHAMHLVLEQKLAES